MIRPHLRIYIGIVMMAASLACATITGSGTPKSVVTLSPETNSPPSAVAASTEEVISSTGVPRLTLTPQPALTPTTDVETATQPSATATQGTSEIWHVYDNAVWHFTVSYPNQVDNKPLYVHESAGAVPQGPEELLLFTDSKVSSLQSTGSDETVRVTAWRSPAGNPSFDLWSALMSANFNLASLTAGKVGTCTANSAQSDSGLQKMIEARWVETADYYLGLTIESARSVPDLARIADSFLPEGCKP